MHWQRQQYHGLVCVLLELDQPDPGDIVQVHVPVGALGRVPVQVGRGGRRCHPQRLVTVDLVGDHVVGLQQGLRGRGVWGVGSKLDMLHRHDG